MSTKAQLDAERLIRQQRGLQLQLLNNIARPEHNHYISDDPGKHTQPFIHSMEQAHAEAADASRKWQSDAAQVSPYIKRAAQLLFAANQSQPEAMFRLYQLMERGQAATAAEYQETIALSQQLFDPPLADKRVDTDAETEKALGTAKISRRVFTTKAAIGGAVLTGLGTLGAAKQVYDAIFDDVPNIDKPKAMFYGALTATGVVATFGMAITAAMISESQKAEQDAARDKAKKNKQ